MPTPEAPLPIHRHTLRRFRCLFVSHTRTIPKKVFFVKPLNMFDYRTGVVYTTCRE